MLNSDDLKNLCPQPPTTSQGNLEENKNVLNVSLLIQWCEDDDPNRWKYILETTFQTWASTQKNTAKGRITCEVTKVSKDGTAVLLSIKPPPDLFELVKLQGRMLPRKDGKMLHVKSVRWDGDGALTPQEDVMKAPPSPLLSEKQHEQVPVNKEEGCADPLAAVFTTGNGYLVLQGEEFLALNCKYSKNVRSIEKRNNCVMKAKVLVDFTRGEGEGDPQKALSDLEAFILSSVVRPGRQDEEELDTQTRIDKPKEDFPLAQSSQEQSVPRETMEVFSGRERWVDYPEGSLWTSQQTAGHVKVDIDDPLYRSGITLEIKCWEQMKLYYSDHLSKIKKKFSVQVVEQEHHGQGKVSVRAGGGNAALENHAVRALSRLYKMFVTLPFNPQDLAGTAGFISPGPQKNAPMWDGDKPLLSSQSEDSAVTKKAMVEAAVEGAADDEENCPICLDRFRVKTQLACKHEFCSDCLDNAIKVLGPCCPVCKHVFGVIVANQPDGTMTTTVVPESLPGFPQYDTIVIIYNISGGIQTEKHPKPGKYFHGTQRKAYLPNNTEGKKVLHLLRKAFNQKLIFTIGQSITNNTADQVTWNDIHHKTSMHGGPTCFGYPDPDYLRRVRDELKAKGIE